MVICRDAHSVQKKNNFLEKKDAPGSHRQPLSSTDRHTSTALPRMTNKQTKTRETAANGEKWLLLGKEGDTRDRGRQERTLPAATGPEANQVFSLARAYTPIFSFFRPTRGTGILCLSFYYRGVGATKVGGQRRRRSSDRLPKHMLVLFIRAVCPLLCAPSPRGDPLAPFELVAW